MSAITRLGLSTLTVALVVALNTGLLFILFLIALGDHIEDMERPSKISILYELDDQIEQVLANLPDQNEDGSDYGTSRNFSPERRLEQLNELNTLVNKKHRLLDTLSPTKKSQVLFSFMGKAMLIMLGTGFITSSIVIVLNILAARQLRLDFKALTHGIEEFSKGNLDHNIKVTPDSDMVPLATALNNLSDELRAMSTTTAAADPTPD